MKEKVKISDEAKALCLTTLGTIRLRNRDFPATKVLHLQNCMLNHICNQQIRYVLSDSNEIF